MKSTIIHLCKKFKPIGFSGLSIYDVANLFWKGLNEGSITTRASSLAFNFFLAFFPSIIVFFTLIPYIPILGLQETLLELLEVVLPSSTNELAFSTLNDIINNPRGDLLSIGFILALYFSSNGINSLIETFNASYHIKEVRSIIRQRILSLTLTFILSLMLIVGMGLIIFGKTLINYLTLIELITSNNVLLILYAKWIIIITMLFFGISLLFHLGPSGKRKFQLFTAGSIFSTLFIIITSIGFNYYVSHFSDYNKIYGSLGTLIIILLWIYFNSIILLTGFELNASINSKKKDKALNQEL